ncbi:MAG TPA: M20 family metallo-hydrolase [Acidobacteriaceae bacterium]|jgi:N-carbamoyl-L-amino-acid hydrolase|nr:M20 family metallo-hydrolase [Acidobacteriaceae bacterium]
MTKKIEVDAPRLAREIDELAAFSDAEAPAVTRVVFSEQDMRARAWLKVRCTEAGLSIREDAVGNTFIRWEGSRPELPAIATGSHIDAIPHAGKYDGVVGVLGGLESIRALQASGFQPERSIELIQFTSEEPTRFGIGCIGSRLLAGVLGPEADEQLRDSQEETLRAVRTRAGFIGDLASVRLAQETYAAFVELHIEQGPILERESIPIGVVTNIAAPASFFLTVKGQGGHAGGVLMPDRHDALCAAAELILHIEALAKESGSNDTVATAGICDVHPGAINSIPSRVKLGVDLRDTDGARRNRVLVGILAAAEEIASRRAVQVTTKMLNADDPATSAAAILDIIEHACKEEGLYSRRIVARAYHDSSFMAQVAPMAMIFIPCRGGVSHRPDEYASPEHIVAGIQVLAHTLATLSR